MSYRKRLWVVTVVPGIVQRNPYIHMGKPFHAINASLLQFVVVYLGENVGGW